MQEVRYSNEDSVAVATILETRLEPKDLPDCTDGAVDYLLRSGYPFTPQTIKLIIPLMHDLKPALIFDAMFHPPKSQYIADRVFTYGILARMDSLLLNLVL